MNKSGSCWQVTFEAVENINPVLEEFLEEYFDVLACNYTDDGLEQYVAYAPSSFDEEAFLATVKAREIELLAYEKTFLESQNWLKENVIEFKPVEVEEFLIYGVHEKDIPKTDKIMMKIYAATAFGSEHSTTKACLTAISDLNKMSVKHENVLDMGTGSGILALACAKLWQSKITAVDIDEEAVIVTLQNAFDNGAEDLIVAQKSDGYRSELVLKNAPYDIILSNILARPLIEMSESLYKSLNKGGYCVLSGFNEEQLEWVVKSHEELGLKLVKVYEFETWRACIMEKTK